MHQNRMDSIENQNYHLLSRIRYRCHFPLMIRMHGWLRLTKASSPSRFPAEVTHSVRFHPIRSFPAARCFLIRCWIDLWSLRLSSKSIWKWSQTENRYFESIRSAPKIPIARMLMGCQMHCRIRCCQNRFVSCLMWSEM
ncbi:hypothetical protein Mal65_16990 [Crateriforma conspicua]|nr:hypothetical protein Mal65_16990 [Crateriforma conspicua]